MFLLDALSQIFDFFLSIILADQVPQENWQAEVYNFFAALGNFLQLIGGGFG